MKILIIVVARFIDFHLEKNLYRGNQKNNIVKPKINFN